MSHSDHDHSHDHDHHGHGDHDHSACGHHHEVVYNKVVKAKNKVASVLLRNAKTLALTFDERQELPHDCVATDGTALVCHVHEPVEAGDRLVSNTNLWAVVEAAPEALFKVRRGQTGYEAFIHVAGLEMWPVELTEEGAHVVASHECMHMLEHFGLQFEQIEAPMHELSVPEIKHDDCCGHDHGHDHGHEHSHDHGHVHGPDCSHDH